MNQWAQRTTKLACEGNYLDRLHEIYLVEPRKRTVGRKVLDGIEDAYRKKDKILLLNRLLDLGKFPYKDSYVAFLRRDRGAIKRNPRTVDRIYSTLLEMGLEGVIQGITAPKEANTRRGSSFKGWLKKSFKFVPEIEFKTYNRGSVFLDASDTALRNFANSALGAGFQKRPDFVAKSGTKYVVGEAKFLSDLGGNQGRGFEDAIKVAANPAHGAIKASILDGIIWIQSGSSLYQSIENSSLPVFSALLLKDFLLSVA